jgi:magnesium transporter
MQRLYQSVENELESIEDDIGNIEQAIFSDREREMVVAISNINRELLVHKRTLSTHQDALDSLEHAGITVFGENFRNYLRGIAAFHFRVYSRSLGYMDTVNELRNTNDSLLSARQNEVMKNLTVMAFTTLPLTLMAALFGMNTIDTPIVGVPGDFWIIVGSMILLMVVFFSYFKLRKWF